MIVSDYGKYAYDAIPAGDERGHARQSASGAIEVFYGRLSHGLLQDLMQYSRYIKVAFPSWQVKIDIVPNADGLGLKMSVFPASEALDHLTSDPYAWR